ncbi:MAG: sigma-54-dependent Fis family transcriptional regulator [Candidatus Coatesbacteria bacterium]|nr:MAG: sigma-54-dependent Fis family transcriptional regulator [Candidatus Coatesbacteria bacterium]
MARAEKEHILVVDDAQDTLELVQRNLTSEGYGVFTAGDVGEAIKLLESAAVDLVITDMKMPEVSGFDLIRHVRENFPDTELMMITGYPSVPDAVKAVKTGAEEYLPKPFTDEELLSTVERVLEKLRLRRKARGVESEVKRTYHGLIGESKAMQIINDEIEKAATTDATVLISGESGTGKELVARAIHYESRRASAPFIPVNCGAIPSELLESELFGYVKGAFTGARETRAGFFQTADGGTIFLDEISETSQQMQVKLLRVLQDKEFYMVGSRRSQKVDVRIEAATNKDLLNLVEKTAFRDDLYYRLAVITIDVPPLRERGDDILLLTSHFLAKYAKESDKIVPELSDGVIDIIKGYNWPGNVRELENFIQRLVVMSESDTIDVQDLPSLMRFRAPSKSGLNRTLEEVEAEHIANVLASVEGNKTKAAGILGIDRKTLRKKLEKVRNKE